ncbi:hypothetical protein ABZV75_01150 [Streptomyces flaveolus]|uniref:hypothetical protein n=1 Tax=Streptomyces flaveolus TaxID=67297 RepID=UPI0033A2754C
MASAVGAFLSLREVLPPDVLAAGYSVMYAAVGAGYAATGSLAGVLLPCTAPFRMVMLWGTWESVDLAHPPA